MERPDFFTLKNGEKAKLPFTDQEYQRRLNNLRTMMSRNDIDAGHISLHPAGIPHGPHPGAMERSIGKKSTNELAVMVDTFKPLMVTEDALEIADNDYYKSWLD